MFVHPICYILPTIPLCFLNHLMRKVLTAIHRTIIFRPPYYLSLRARTTVDSMGKNLFRACFKSASENHYISLSITLLVTSLFEMFSALECWTVLFTLTSAYIFGVLVCGADISVHDVTWHYLCMIFTHTTTMHCIAKLRCDALQKLSRYNTFLSYSGYCAQAPWSRCSYKNTILHAG